METIQIAFTLNNKFAEMAGVAMTSIAMTTRHMVCFNLLIDDLEQEHINKFDSITGRYPLCKMRYHPMQNTSFSHLPSGDKMAASYYRILLPEILPELEKVLYLDSDIVVEDDLWSLWSTDLTGFLAGACLNRRDSTPISMHNLGLLKEKLGIGPREMYFNSGVMLLNMATWRAENVSDLVLENIPKVTELTQKYNLYTSRDQNALNYTLKRRVRQLPPKYNAIVCHDLFSGLMGSVTEWVESVNQPVILHFSGEMRSDKITRQWLPDHWERYFYYKGHSPHRDPQDEVRVEKYKTLLQREVLGPVQYHPYLERFLDDILRSSARSVKAAHPGKTIVLWGAGDFVANVVVLFAAEGVEVEAIVDGLVENGHRKVYHYEVQPPIILEEFDPKDTVVVLSTLNKHPATLKSLHGLGYTDTNIVHALAELLAVQEPL